VLNLSTTEEMIMLIKRGNCVAITIVLQGVLIFFGAMFNENVHSAPGELDAAFGTGGIAIFGPSVRNGAAAVALQDDANIVIAGASDNGDSTDSDFIIIRLKPNGLLDPTFGVDGLVRVDVSGNGSEDSARAIGIQSDGKIVVAGNVTIVPFDNIDIGLARFNADGSLDHSFGSGGTVITPVGGGFDLVHSLKIQSDGKIVVAGETETETGSRDYLLIRYDTNGGMDLGFGNAGVVKTDFSGQTDAVRSLTIQDDGKIIAAGYSRVIPGSPTSYFSIARYTSTGILDNSFGSGGKVSTDVSGSGLESAGSSALLRSDGRLIVGGLAWVGSLWHLALAQYEPNGELDATFGQGGKSIFQIGAVRSRITSISLQSDGKILASGILVPSEYVVARVNSHGTLDETFGSSGYVTGPLGNANSSALQPDGKLVVVGDIGSPSQIQIARYIGDNNAISMPAPFDFDGDGKTDVSIFRPSVGQWWYGKSSDGGHGAAVFGTSSDVIVPADYTGDGRTDMAFWRPSSGEWFILRSEDFSFYAFPFGGNGDIPAPADYDGDGKADAAVYRPSNGTWYILRSSDGQVVITGFGVSGDKPIPADYDGDGKADIGVFRANGTHGAEWWIMRSTAGLLAVQFGSSNVKAVPGDYTGDGKADIAFFSSTGGWYILRSEDLSFYSFPFGVGSDIPVPGDYDGDGKMDAAVFRSSAATWYMQGSTSGTIITTFGLSGDRPVPNAFVR
jgi:uncharacterized delta-60 repeat protein